MPSLFLCIATLLAAASPSVRFSAQGGDSAAGMSVAPGSLGALLQEIEAANRDDIGRDPSGNVVSLTLRQGWANDYNLTLISGLNSLQRLVLVLSRRAEPTEHGLASLGTLTNLVSLHLSCSGPLQAGFFRAACTLKRLRCLDLYAACPPAAEYKSLTNLQLLAELRVSYCPNFGDEQLSLVTNLTNLRSLELKADALSSEATNLLAGMRTLTNILIKPSAQR